MTPQLEVRRPRPQALPGMAGNAIPPIEAAAERYEIDRDARMECMTLELESKGTLINVNKKRGKKVYRRRLPDGETLEIVLDHEERDTVRVKRVVADKK